MCSTASKAGPDTPFLVGKYMRTQQLGSHQTHVRLMRSQQAPFDAEPNARLGTCVGKCALRTQPKTLKTNALIGSPHKGASVHAHSRGHANSQTSERKCAAVAATKKQKPYRGGHFAALVPSTEDVNESADPAERTPYCLMPLSEFLRSRLGVTPPARPGSGGHALRGVIGSPGSCAWRGVSSGAEL